MALMVTGILRLATMPVDSLPATSPPATSATSATPAAALPVSPAGDMMVIGLTPAGPRTGVTGLSVLAGATIERRLRELPGVASVAVVGQAGVAHVRGDPGLVLIVREAPAVGVLAVSREVDQALAAMAPVLPGVTVDPSLFREDTYAKSALDNVRVALVGAAVLVALALLVLLLQLRLVFTALFCMALSIIAAATVLDLLGYTLNAIVALGLLLALALVVTEAACAAQAIASRIDGGHTGSSRLVAAAGRHLRGALTAASLAALLCVVPLLLATGRTASFLRPMAVAFALAVIAALLVAVTVTPALATVLLSVVPPTAHGTPLPRLLAGGYTRSVGALAAAPRLRVACAAACAAVGVAGLALLPVLHAEQPALQDRSLIAALTPVSGPSRMPATELDRLTTRVSDELLALPAVADVGAAIGPRGSELWVTLTTDADYGPAVAATRGVAATVPGVTGTVRTNETYSMAGVLTGPHHEPVSTRIAFICYVIIALAGVLLFALAATGNWRLALLAFGSLPASLAGGVLTALALGATRELAAIAGLAAVFALAARQAIAVTARTQAAVAAGADAAGLAAILTPAVVTAVALAPFAAMGNVPGMELLHTAATVILGGLVTTTLVSLFVLPVLAGFRRSLSCS